MSKKIAITIIIISIFIVFGGLFAYSYINLFVELNDVKLLSIDWKTLSWDILSSVGLDALTGNWLDAAFGLIEAINLNLIFSLTNNGFLPVHIPNLTYDVIINDIHIGTGESKINTIIYPGQTIEIVSFQNLQKSGLEPAIKSIVESQGIMELKIRGVAIFNILWIDVPIPFESSKEVSVYTEIRNKLAAEIQKNQVETSSAVDSLGKTIGNVIDSIVAQIFGTDDEESSFLGEPIIDSTYMVSPGKYQSIPISVDCNANLHVAFSASSPLGNNIFLYVFDEHNYLKFQNSQGIFSIYNSDKVESGEFDILLKPGDYYIVLSNTYSTISEKSVKLQASTICI
ncbi:MAG: hypothetical protein K5790_07140 [Nitrosopumilus sp.]|uniref:hypothetical protein n=1 Tax=Nitrosopumilus sp. TaxID=2024843 RepID=UPI00247D7135|nr:hypothetical protein [Nitrosopumilus sp.]MCV0393048.1 hypothetical protein [Nitrosopumilus sp.]